MRVAVTGAFGYSGRYIAQRLLAAGQTVTTLTNSVKRHNPFGERSRASPFELNHPACWRRKFNEYVAEAIAGPPEL